MIGLFSPDQCVPGVWDIDLGALASRGINAIILDIDNTVAPWRENAIPSLIIAWIDEARQKGFKLCLLTNNTRSRADHFRQLLGIPAVWGWVKPWPWGFRKALRTIGARPENAAMVGDQLFTDVLGARRLGMYVILVTPLSGKDGLFTRLKRRVERRVLGERKR